MAGREYPVSDIHIRRAERVERAKMKRIHLIAISLAFLPALALAQSPLDGTWKVEANKAQVSKMRFDISLSAGEYACRSCRPPWLVPADGVFHPVVGHSDFDETSVRVVDDRKVEFTRRKGARVVYRAVDTVSEDGKLLDFWWTESNENGGEVSGTGSWTRVSPGPAKSHPISGTWRELRPNSMSDSARTFAIHVDGDHLKETFGTGESLVAKFGGPPATVHGDPSGTLVSVRWISNRAFEESDLLNGKIVAIRTMTLLDDSTLEIVSRNKVTGKETRRRARLQGAPAR